MRKFLLCLVVPAVFAIPATAGAGELKLTIKDGLVTLVAQDVPLSMVMAEWAKVGQTRVVNGEKILTPVTLQLVDVPERRALDIILRSASGYMLAERSAPVANASASAFDRILILPTSRPPANSPVNTPPPFNQPRPVPARPMPDMDDDDGEPTDNGPPGAAPMPPNVPNRQPGQPSAQPGQPSAQPGQPGGPLTAPRPGPLPQPPQQPVPFGGPPKPAGGGGGGGGSQG